MKKINNPPPDNAVKPPAPPGPPPVPTAIKQMNVTSIIPVTKTIEKHAEPLAGNVLICPHCQNNVFSPIPLVMPQKVEEKTISINVPYSIKLFKIDFDKMIDKVVKAGYNYNVAKELKKVSKYMDKQYKRCPEQPLNDNSFNKLKDMLKSFKPTKKNVKRSRDKNLKELSAEQLSTALNILHNIFVYFEEERLDLIAAELNNCSNHLNLAIAIAEENKRKMKYYRDIDTNIRNVISKRVWDFLVTI